MAVTDARESATSALRAFLEQEVADFPARAWVWHALEARGKLLAQGSGFCWGLLPIWVCRAAGGWVTSALPLSTATECLIAALDVLDDVQDGDAPDALWRDCGIPTATNVATLLHFLSQLAIGELRPQGLPAETVSAISQTFASAGARACGGQQQDLEHATSRRADEEQYFEMIARKTGALLEGICRAAALLTQGDPDSACVSTYAEFGLNLGISMQIANDIAAVSSESEERADLRAAKPTLPILFLHESGIMRDTEEDRERPPELLKESGAIEYALTIADVYRERAANCLMQADCPRDSPLFALVTAPTVWPDCEAEGA